MRFGRKESRSRLAALCCAAFMVIAPCAYASTAAGLSPSMLGKATLSAPRGALPLQEPFSDQYGQATSLAQALQGRPAVIVFIDPECHNLCGVLLMSAVRALEKTHLRAGLDYRLVAISLRSRSNPAAQDMSLALGNAALLLTGSEDALSSTAGALGYRFAYDSEHDQFAHPAAVFVVSGAGRFAGALPGLTLDPGELRLALIAAGDGRNATIGDRVQLLCYGFGPSRGLYTAAVLRGIRMAGAVTIGLLGVGFLVLRRRRRVAP